MHWHWQFTQTCIQFYNFIYLNKNFDTSVNRLDNGNPNEYVIQEINSTHLQQFAGQYVGIQAAQEHEYCHHHYKQSHLNEENGK